MSGNVCPECGVDILIFEKTLKISDVLYNKGLDLARIRDLSGSIDSLTKSIQFNKNNYYARNLLGLVYFEVGKIAEALKQWVMSASLLKDGNPAVHYIEKVQMTPGLLDDGNDAISMYNSALFHIHQKSDDLAVIQLKKALELSPSFIEAMNLLTFCYLIKGEKQMASVLVERVLELDINNPVTLNYYNALFPDKKRVSLKEIREPDMPTVQSLIPGKLLDEMKRRKLASNNFFFVEALSFVVGVICTLALLFLTYIPGTVADATREINELRVALAAAEDELARVIQEAENDTMRLERELREARAEAAVLAALVAADDQVQQVDLAWARHSAGNFLEAALVVERINPIGMDDHTLRRFEEVREISFRAVSADSFNDGQLYFNAGNFAAARVAFEMSLSFLPDDNDWEDSIFFLFGRMAEMDGDIDLAIQYYRVVVEEHPQSWRRPDANERLDALEG